MFYYKALYKIYIKSLNFKTRLKQMKKNYIPMAGYTKPLAAFRFCMSMPIQSIETPQTQVFSMEG